MSGMEIERKFLVHGTDYRRLARSSSHIQQGYICKGGGCTVRVRRRDSRAYITIKGPSHDGGLSRYEFEKEITLDEGQHLFELCKDGIIDKTRFLVDHAGHTFEVDEFHADNQGLVVAEVELKAADEAYEKPSFIGAEVTGDRRYTNASLSQNPYKNWRQESAAPTPPSSTE